MAVGKAGAHPPEQAATVGSSFVAPCFAGIDERRISDYLDRDNFFWLDLTAPGAQDIERLGEPYLGWLVTKGITATWAFFEPGLGSLLVTCVLLLRFCKRKGWM